MPLAPGPLMKPRIRIRRSTVQWLGLFAGPVLAALAAALMPGPGASPAGLDAAGRATAAVGVWMAVWWMTEAIPVFATSLLPLALLPLLGARSMREAAEPYAHELIFLFLGGFVIALAFRRWGLHERIALRALGLVGSDPRRVVGVFMLITAGLSMWVSNTATAIMLLPIALSVIERVEGGEGAHERRNFALCLLLGIAYAASIGGVGTLIGTPPNLFLASYAGEQLGAPISFVRWMGVGIPLVMVFLPLAWWMLAYVLFPVGAARVEGGAALARREAARLGPLGRGGLATAAVFGLTALAWITRPLLVAWEIGGVRPLAGLTDAGIAISAALVLFVIPVDLRRREFAMDWETAVGLPWGVLLLFGGGLSLAAAIRANGVAEWFGAQVGALGAAPPLLIVVCVTALVIFLTELTSNTATTATLVPILAELAIGLGLPPFQLIVPAALAASCAFMLPVATPPNAVVFASGRVGIPQMCRAGIWLNLLGIAVITALTYAVALPLLVAS